MIILNPGSLHQYLDYSDYKNAATAVADLTSANPAVLS